MEGLIEDDVLAFIRTAIQSVWALELLLLLRQDCGREWSQEELVRELRGSRALVRDGIAALTAAGLVRTAAGGSVSYRPLTPALDRTADRLSCAYRQTPTAVMKAIAAAPNERIQTFADAFRLKP